MNFLRNHWFDLGGVMALIAVPYIFINYKDFTTVQFILLISLVTLFLHQFEEYRYPGYFPGMLNASVYKSNLPDVIRSIHKPHSSLMYTWDGYSIFWL